MTSQGDSRDIIGPLYADGIDLAKLALKTAAKPTTLVDETHRFWVSRARKIDDLTWEVMEISFGAERLVNRVTFKVSRFPVFVRAQYQDRNGDWQALTYANTELRSSSDRQFGHVGPTRVMRRNRVQMVLAGSVPAKVDSAASTGGAHPQHFGSNHWESETWTVIPVKTRKIRFVLERNPMGNMPRDHHNRPVAYSLALKDIKIGYSVTKKSDIPNRTKPGDPWGAGTDILGNHVTYTTYEQPADAAIDGSRDTFWRSEPQPFSYAIANLYLDLRDPSGQAPIIDRFFMDPVTVGPVCNVYYSSDEPEGDFLGLSTPVPGEFVSEVGSPVPVFDGSTGETYALNLGPDQRTGYEASDNFLRMRYDEPWWVGLDAASLVDPADTGRHPLVTVGTTQILRDGPNLTVLAQSGTEVSIPLDPDLHVLNVLYRLVVAYFPADEEQHRPPYFRLVYLMSGFDPQVRELATSGLENSMASIKVGMHPDPTVLDQAAVSVFGLVVKSEMLTPETEQWFLDEGADFVADPPNAQEDRGTALNARLRMHPMFASPENRFGVVGGSGQRYAEMAWTPVVRDYSLKQGYMHLPPTQAKYWKFEMTRLLPQVYENFVTIERDVQVFPPTVVAQHTAAVGKANNTGTPSGVATTANSAEAVAYADALEAVVASSAAPDATTALVINDHAQAAQVAQYGWIWTYQPWHVGSSAPQFIGTQVHAYQNLHVRHTTKVAYFAAIREITPFRVDYTFDDDTPEYVEHLLDDTNIDTITSLVPYAGGLRSISEFGEFISKKMSSYRTVRGVQFATQETDAVQVLDDPNVTDLSKWVPYGDATLSSDGANSLTVDRGWFPKTYGYHEAFTYGALDGQTYTQLQGNSPTGYAEGGVLSQTYTPSGAGKISAAVDVSANEELTAPIIVEIVASFGNRVLASQTRWIKSGETFSFDLGWAPGALTQNRTYANLETLVSAPTTYEQLETDRYFELESNRVFSDVFVRVRQKGGSRDSFSVQRVGLLDSPVAWFFSNDDGTTWWQAIDVGNDPHAVLMFPFSDHPEVPGTGTSLRWRAKVYQENAVINALHVRPWYGDRSHTVRAAYSMDALGPNKSIYDDFPGTDKHPMWQPRVNLIGHATDTGLGLGPAPGEIPPDALLLDPDLIVPDSPTDTASQGAVLDPDLLVP